MGAPAVDFSGFHQENPSCDDATAFAVTVHNAGTSDARSVRFTAAAVGGTEDFSQDLGDLAAGSATEVHGVVRVHDTCGVEDRYALAMRAEPANGPAATLTASIST